MNAADNTTKRAARVRAATRWRRLVRVAALAIVLLLAGTGVALTLVTNGFVNSGRIARNVTIEGVAVEGKTVADASAALEREWVPRLPKELELAYPGGSLRIPPSKLGAKLRIDEAAAAAHRVGREGGMIDRIITQVRLRRRPVGIEVECRVNEEALDAALADIAGQVNKQPKNAQVQVTDDEDVIVKPHVVGLVLNLEKSKTALLEGLKDVQARDVKLVVTEQQPDIKAEDLRYLDTVLGSYTPVRSAGPRICASPLSRSTRAWSCRESSSRSTTRWASALPTAAIRRRPFSGREATSARTTAAGCVRWRRPSSAPRCGRT